MNRQVPTLRGFACVLLVLYHVIGSEPSTALKVADGPLRWFNDGLAYLRMPLFIFLSGMVYGARPFDGDSRRFLVGKFRRLLVPMFVVGTLLAVVRANMPGTNMAPRNWWMLHVMPFAHYWFVEALFWVFLMVWFAERNRLISTPTRLAMAWALAVGLYLTVRGTPLFSIDSAIYLLPYFLSGLAVTRFDLWPTLGKHKVQGVLLALAAFAVWQLGMPIPNQDRRTVLVLVAGLALCGLCLALRIEVRWLERIGMTSYTIYLFHVFFTAASGIALSKAGLDVLPVSILAGLAAGLVGPMVIDNYASRYRWPALLLLGKSAPLAR